MESVGEEPPALVPTTGVTSGHFLTTWDSYAARKCEVCLEIVFPDTEAPSDKGSASPMQESMFLEHRSLSWSAAQADMLRCYAILVGGCTGCC